MSKHCENCGSIIETEHKFCPECGKPVANESQQGLPSGITKTSDGKIWWNSNYKKLSYLCYFDDEKIGIMIEDENRKSSILGEMLIDAMDIVLLEREPYSFTELPSDMRGDGTTPIVQMNGKNYRYYPYEYRYVSAVKENKKKNLLKVYISTGKWSFGLTPEQYDFVLNHFLTHCSNIKRK